MNTAKGDLWAVEADARVITTNGFVRNDGNAVMGRGVAAQARARYAGIEADLGVLIRRAGTHVYLLPTGTNGWPFVLVAFPVKHNWFEAADPALIQRSARELAMLVDIYGWRKVVLPRPGCGNGRLSWADVRPLIDDVLDERFTVVSPEGE